MATAFQVVARLLESSRDHQEQRVIDLKAFGILFPSEPADLQSRGHVSQRQERPHGACPPVR